MRRLIDPSRRRAPRRGLALLDVIVGGIMLGIGLSVLLTLTTRSLAQQTNGEKRMTATWLADELLSLVVVEGPDEYSLRQDTAGEFTAPFTEFSFEVEIDELGRELPYEVTATVWWGPGDSQSVTVQTIVARRRGEREEPRAREPLEPLDREQRYYDDEFGTDEEPEVETP
jgi:hypothetical protein